MTTMLTAADVRIGLERRGPSVDSEEVAVATLADLFAQAAEEVPEDLPLLGRAVRNHPVFAPLLQRLESVYAGRLKRGSAAYWKAVRHAFLLDMIIAHEDRHPAWLMTCKRQDVDVLFSLVVDCVEQATDEDLRRRLHSAHVKIATLWRSHRRAVKRLELRGMNVGPLPALWG